MQSPGCREKSTVTRQFPDDASWMPVALPRMNLFVYRDLWTLRAPARLSRAGAGSPIWDSIHVRRRPAHGRSELEMLENEQRDALRPDLGVQRVGRGSDEGLDPEIPRQGLEQQLHLPPVLVDAADRGLAQVRVGIGQRRPRRGPDAEMGELPLATRHRFPAASGPTPVNRRASRRTGP